MLLATPELDLELATRKVRILCADDINEAAASGRCGGLLYCISQHIRQFLFPDTEMNEEYNSLIKIQVTRCPNIGLPLVSHRVSIKKTLGIGGGGGGDTAANPQTVKWSHVRPRARAILDQCMSVLDEIPRVQANPSRWESPKPAEDASMPDIPFAAKCILNPDLRLSGQTLWATAQSRLWHSREKNIDVRSGFVFAAVGGAPVLSIGNEVHFVLEKTILWVQRSWVALGWHLIWPALNFGTCSSFFH